MSNWAKESPDEFAIVQDLAAFDVDFFNNYQPILFAKQQSARTEDSGNVGDGLLTPAVSDRSPPVFKIGGSGVEQAQA